MEHRRVTQRDVARAAGVTRPTVSLALRHDPTIPKSTRDRILQIADKLGYAPDPVLSALASYRWPTSGKKRAAVSFAIVAFTPRTVSSPLGYSARVEQGALDRAKRLGLATTVFHVGDYEGNMKRMLRVIRTRGFTGILLLPSIDPVALDPDAGWEHFCVVAATTSILAPRFHQVIPNQLYNVNALLTRLQKLGYRKVGAIFTEAYEQRTFHAYSMALAWHGHRDRILIVPGGPRSADAQTRLDRWLRKHKPDLVFIPDFPFLNRIAPLRGEGASTPRFLPPGDLIEHFPELIGETAVRVLSSLMLHNETGIPQHPQITTIDGAVREAELPQDRSSPPHRR